MEQLIANALAAWDLPADKAKPLSEYGAMLLEKNKVMNLTAITDPAGVASLHMADCAPLVSHWHFSGKTVLDVGTGAGFPGMVIAILCPDAQVTLLDPLQKRLDFLSEVCKALSLDNVQLLHRRGEDGGRDPALRETFDFVTARAVADLTVLSELCLPFVKISGAFLAMKSVDCYDELWAAVPHIAELGGVTLPVWDYPVHGTDVVHRVCPIEKGGHTPQKFPRTWNKIKPKT